MPGPGLLTLLAAYAGTGAVFLALDFLWLALVAVGFYRAEIGPLLLGKFNMAPAGIFYLFYVAGIVGFAIVPALATQSWLWALAAGVALGFIAYGTYNMSNLATLKGWSAKLSLVDMLWGAALSGVAALAGYWMAQLTA
ncbi:DUF2177 family protein [Devosia rhizoryzae]|uniref:DUF2177 family protein n=1 Tax=Devosia rhizoryzae TaxID=2774137 RepID=A0ABX7C3W9_9HYPH|nr:DUF2177 family protein [Devosia rhizoryzae]QQR38781.1 DUF2177 family protein [Devosia rhizoryzae]